MPCALTQSYTLDCRDSIGGLKEVWFAALDDIATWTGSNGAYTAITMDSGKYFWKYDLENGKIRNNKIKSNFSSGNSNGINE